MTVVRDVPKQLFIGGDWQDAESGRTLSVDNPATGEELCQVADASPADGRRAVEAAVAAQAAWAATPPRVRSEILRRAYDIIIARTEDLALLMTLEMGKPLAEARAEVAYGAEFFRWFSEEAVRIDGGLMTAPDGKNRLLVARQPVGPCLLITPWNFPLAMGTRKIGPAVAAGCTIVLKPAPQTPLTSLALAEILTEAGLPAGVLNIVTTTDAAGVVEPLLRGGKIRKLSFTGSTQVGRILLAQCADTVIRTSMELGGNAPLIVFDDADLDVAVEGTMVAKMRNMGESCCAANRIFVHTSVADEFAQRLTARMAALTVGPGTEPGTDVGPLIDLAGRSKAHDLVRDAVKRGATALTGGELPEGPGCFYPPTVLTGIAPDSAIIDTEIFGPVAAIRAFETEDEAVAAANDTEFGLVAYLFTQNLDRAMRVAERLESGMIGINTGLVSNPAAPFGGVKQSGLGREGGLVGIDEFLEYKYMAVPVGA
ncbi:NAD-dependent succinate-semialdehyde dehydrogenase [Streptomyces caniscabiei]|uniref:NAD-dependent succinate-semialdehyde dehydrogenase n=1 Tax=Streptomyces caniscabiei TaxID=2746961 RepID=A0ABU4MR03_9ACTN|nr:NAD-dependent succinate-semialdehyde dehydrogenase [Streptomyces caniscabiei]MBE4734215.1 NAD-dependent succinate-semialdehyde dehydrogenase [Streptomyces caniscabiei]MBE4759177.1 NAD-dependent succinate-semialdehyde dehydrogenase [Streptomyces caniscabiei]MBE4773242.1 NAD-dependent succinate-semialdehyde dehydrogenase [Streptomyces caniscabiei]MBE4783629.1 NAD-dependent succinate-semialdehyde dehydrogenase [Streptomyces caniscabiei]MBE4792933.1 NAD-dependent succinate-semialdehyde dehydrog